MFSVGLEQWRRRDSPANVYLYLRIYIYIYIQDGLLILRWYIYIRVEYLRSDYLYCELIWVV